MNKLRHPFFLILCSILVVTLVYLPALNAPFYLDDFLSIKDNPAFIQCDFSLLFNMYGSRILGYLSLYLSYLVSPDNPFAYRVVNIVIHLANGALIYLLYQQLCRFLKCETNNAVVYVFILLWLIHPLHSNAVTYVVQRLASQATLFVLAALYSYLSFKLERRKRWLLVAVMFTVCAVLTKQNAVVLPLLVLCLESLYGRHRKALGLLTLLSIFFLASLIWFAPDVLLWADRFSRETTSYSRFEYFSAQWYILLLYWQKLFFLYPLQLDMTMPMASITQFQRYSALAVHISFLILAVLSRRRLPLLTVAVLWFYILHLVESGLIPITDIAFEHRAYLPNICVVLGFSAVVQVLVKYAPARTWLPGAVLILSATAGAGYQRSELWSEPEQLHLQDVSTNPTAAKALATLGSIYAEQNRLAEANEYLTKSFEYQFNQGMVSVGTIVNIMKIRFGMKDYQSGIKLAHLGLAHIKESRMRSELLAAMAVGYINMGYCDFAKGLINTALQLHPENQQALFIKDVCK